MKTILGILFFTLFSAGTTQISLNTAKSTLQVKGTSTMHDWESIVTDFQVTGEITNGYIKGLKVTVDAKSIQSGKSLMDEKTFEALKTDKNPTITLKAAHLIIDSDKVTGSGELTIAGKTQKIILTAKIIDQTANELHLSGQTDITMTQFGIKPPTAMFGSIKTGDAVTIEYDIFLNK